MKIIFTETAKMRLHQIFDYYKEFVGVEKARQRVSKIKNHTTQLIKMPYSGAKEMMLENEQEEYRHLIEGNYKIIYHIDNNLIIIDTIFDTRQNPLSLEEEME